jgi:hypothetical protein
MKQLVLLTIVFTFFVSTINAQSVGVNTTGAAANISSLLDIDVSALSPKKGLLIPRVTLTDRTVGMATLPAAAQGLLVYQTDGVEGFYYNTSLTTTANWIYLSPGGGGGGRWDQITAPAGNLSLAHGAYNSSFTFDGVTTASAFAMSSSSLTTGDLLRLTSTSISAPGAGQMAPVLTINKSGANTNSAVRSIGIYSSVTNTGTTSTNTAGFFYASGASLNNVGVDARTDADGGYGVLAINYSSGTGSQTGISGTKSGNTGTGVGYGVRGSASGSGNLNFGGSFDASGALTNYGVSGIASGPGTTNIGGDFNALGAGSNNYAVRGTINANTGYAIYGQNYSTATGSQYGVYGTKTGATVTGTGYGVYGTATGSGANMAA